MHPHKKGLTSISQFNTVLAFITWIIFLNYFYCTSWIIYRPDVKVKVILEGVFEKLRNLNLFLSFCSPFPRSTFLNESSRKTFQRKIKAIYTKYIKLCVLALKVESKNLLQSDIYDIIRLISSVDSAQNSLVFSQHWQNKA